MLSYKFFLLSQASLLGGLPNECLNFLILIMNNKLCACFVMVASSLGGGREEAGSVHRCPSFGGDGEAHILLPP